ncbi:phosphate ABC transporter permease PstA [Yunchengibacter salinarum]|uniref:phosphate ABC transporter permease PstA n=1 Tax=Yunchengibacter salinarum TaxID=3133399 RepID=UPI0035B6444B
MEDHDMPSRETGRDARHPTDWMGPAMQAQLRRRYRRERLFRGIGLGALLVAGLFLATLLFTIVRDGAGGFFQTEIALDVPIQEDVVGDPESMTPSAFADRVKKANMLDLIMPALLNQFPEVETPAMQRRLRKILSRGARMEVRDFILSNPKSVGETRRLWLLASDDLDQVNKGNVDISLPESDRPIKDLELGWFNDLESAGQVDTRFHTLFLSTGASRDPELAGIWGAAVGSFLTLLVTFLVAFPLGVLSAIYLEEFAPSNRITDFIEININNLAAVPSIVFGLLGLAVFLGTFDLPRSAPLVGGLTLSLMTLPTIIISSRAAIKAVPSSLRDAARGLGASPMQVVFHQVVPSAMPGMLTGSIIGMAQALGETAPLLMIGMVAFIVDVPTGITDAATALPVQIYLWADSPERAFVEKTSAAIMVLLAFLIFMNAIAIWLRNKFETK